VTTIWLYTFADHSVVKIPQPDGRCNDTVPHVERGQGVFPFRQEWGIQPVFI